MSGSRLTSAILLAAPLLLSGCGGKPASVAPVDSALEQTAHSARQALDFDHPAQAVQLYQHAFTLALARNDAGAIGDCGYDLATAQLANRDGLGALQSVGRTRAALVARASPSFAELDLVEAAALFRLGRAAEADPLAARAQASASDQGTITQASMLRGLIAYQAGDQAAVASALAAFGTPGRPDQANTDPGNTDPGTTDPGTTDPDWQADHDTLAARLALLRGQAREAARLAQSAADIERRQLHDQAMAEQLAFAADALRHGGDAARAADLDLQAGQSAAARGDKPDAQRWLDLAAMPGASITTQQAAAGGLAGLSGAPGR